MKRVALTGASGRIGRAIAAGLNGRYDFVPMSRRLNGADLRDPDGLAARFLQCDAVIHLAWQFASDDALARGELGQGTLDNVLMHRNVLHAAKAAGAGQVVMASSVHADFFYDRQGQPPLHPDARPRANDLYGAAKLMIEALGRDLAEPSFRVTDIRYGAVTDRDEPHPRDAWERRVWLSHADLCRLIDAVLSTEDRPPYARLYAVSDNEGRVHDTANPFGWTPQDRATALPPEAPEGSADPNASARLETP